MGKPVERRRLPVAQAGDGFTQHGKRGALAETPGGAQGAAPRGPAGSGRAGGCGTRAGTRASPAGPAWAVAPGVGRGPRRWAARAARPAATWGPPPRGPGRAQAGERQALRRGGQGAPPRAPTLALSAAPRAPGAGPGGLPAGGAQHRAAGGRVLARAQLLQVGDGRGQQPGGHGRRGARRAAGGPGRAAAHAWGAGAPPPLGGRGAPAAGPAPAAARRARCGRLVPRARLAPTPGLVPQQKNVGGEVGLRDRPRDQIRRRQWPQACVPLRSGTGAMPAYFGSSAADV